MAKKPTIDGPYQTCRALTEAERGDLREALERDDDALCLLQEFVEREQVYGSQCSHEDAIAWVACSTGDADHIAREHVELSAGRLQSAGYIHSAGVEPDATYTLTDAGRERGKVGA